jgi:tetratricopeptide (TPR) repeat protein
MKKLTLLVILVLTITMGFAQKNVRQTASNFLKDGKLDKAMEAINQCIQDPSTASDPKAWFIRGNIYLEIANTQIPEYKSLDPNPLQQSLDSYKKATEYDTKKEYTEDIFAKVNWQRNNYFNQAVDNYNKKLYVESMLAFENAAKALQSINVADTVSLFYAAACAGMANEKGKAKEYYVELLKQNAKSTSIYVSLADIYRLEKDSAAALKVIRAGQKLYPGDLKLFLTETNIYLTFGDTKKALSNLKVATAKDSSNATVFFALGTIYDNLSTDTLNTVKDREVYLNEAIYAYQKAIKLIPTYFEPNYNIGALYVNKAATVYDVANKLPLDAEKEFAKLNGEANTYLELAIPYLEKAAEIQPTDLNTLNSLKQIYSRLKKMEQLKAVNEKINGLIKK